MPSTSTAASRPPRELVHRLFDPLIAESAGLGAGLDWKTSLQELCARAVGSACPEYVVAESGPDHEKSFRARRARRRGPVRRRHAAAARRRPSRRPPPPRTPSSATSATHCRRRPQRRTSVPELPEVEVVRRGLARWVAGRTVRRRRGAAPARRPPSRRRRRATSRARLAGRTDRRPRAGAASTCGCPLDGARRRALVAHLGMSGQLLRAAARRPDETHLRARVTFTDGGRELRFVDQRTFGGLALDDARARRRRRPRPGVGRAHRPRPARPGVRRRRCGCAALRRRRTGLKRALLDQTLVVGRRQHLRRRGALARPAALGPRRPTTLPRPGPASCWATSAT